MHFGQGGRRIGSGRGGVGRGASGGRESDAQEEDVGGGDQDEEVTNVRFEDARFGIHQSHAKDRFVQLSGVEKRQSKLFFE